MVVDVKGIVKDANLPEFAAITGGLLLSEYLEKPMIDWGFDANTRNLTRLLGGEVIAFAMNTMTPEYSPYVAWVKGLSYVPTAIAADGVKRYAAAALKLGIAGAPERVIIREGRPAPQMRPAPQPAPAQIMSSRQIQPAIKVGTELSDEELRNLGFLR